MKIFSEYMKTFRGFLQQEHLKFNRDLFLKTLLTCNTAKSIVAIKRKMADLKTNTSKFCHEWTTIILMFLNINKVQANTGTVFNIILWGWIILESHSNNIFSGFLEVQNSNNYHNNHNNNDFATTYRNFELRSSGNKSVQQLLCLRATILFQSVEPSLWVKLQELEGQKPCSVIFASH